MTDRHRRNVRLLPVVALAVWFGVATPTGASAPPDGTGAPSEPPPASMAPPSPPPPPVAAGPDQIFGACKDQGPLISGQVLARLLVAVPAQAQVVGLEVRSRGGRVREIEIPYHGWSVTTGEEGATGTVDGEPAPVDHFWFWVAFVDVTASELVVEVTARLIDGSVVTHRGDGGDEDQERPALRIPVDLGNLPDIAATGAAAGTTPQGDREPCRIGRHPGKPDDGDPAGGSATLPLVAAVGTGLLTGILGGWLLARRRQPTR